VGSVEGCEVVEGEVGGDCLKLKKKKKRRSKSASRRGLVGGRCSRETDCEEGETWEGVCRLDLEGSERLRGESTGRVRKSFIFGILSLIRSVERRRLEGRED